VSRGRNRGADAAGSLHPVEGRARSLKPGRSEHSAHWYHFGIMRGMAMTLRMNQDQDQMVERLSEQWGVSKNEAILRAISLADEESETDRRYLEAYERVSTKYKDALDRLGSA